jgi:hypothetical protein
MSQTKAPRAGGAFLDEEKSSIGRTDGRSWEAVLRLWQTTADAGFRGINPLFQPLNAPADGLGDVAGRSQDDSLNPFQILSLYWHNGILTRVIEADDYSAFPEIPRRRLSPWRITVAPFWPAVMPFL